MTKYEITFGMEKIMMTDRAAKFARWIFWIAGIYGLIVLMPQYFLEGRIGQDDPPAITHPEYFYGFVGIGTSWQIAFLIMSRAPQKYRLIIIPSCLEKFSFGFAVVALFFLGRASVKLLGFGVVDLVFGALFVKAFFDTKPTGSDS